MPGPVQFTADMLRAATAPQDEPEPTPALVRLMQGPKTKPLTTQNVLKLAKARLRDVKAELRRMKTLEKERDELQRLVDAAEHKPRLVALKKTAG